MAIDELCVEWGSTNTAGTSMFKISLTVFGRYAQKNTGLQGSTLSGPRMTTGFGPFQLPTRGLLQKGRDHSPPKVCFEEPSFWLAHSAMGIHSAINIQLLNKLGVGLNGGVIILTYNN